VILLFLQLSVTASVAGNAARSDEFYRDREAFGLRYQSPAIFTVNSQPFNLQAGLMMANENGLFPSKSGEGMRHWAVDAQQAFAPWLHAQLSFGRFTEQRSDDREHPGLAQLDYYEFVGLGVELRRGNTAVMFEKLLAEPVSAHVALHSFVTRLSSPALDVMVQYMTNSADQPTYSFWTAEATFRPAWRAPSPWRYLGIQGGSRPVPAYDANRSVALTFLSAGLFLGAPVP